MNPEHTSETSRDVDLQSTRRTFLFAREQVAANTRPERYSAAHALHRWTPNRARRAHRATDTAESAAR
jgi:hypothetical protein